MFSEEGEECCCNYCCNSAEDWNVIIGMCLLFTRACRVGYHMTNRSVSIGDHGDKRASM